MPFNSGCLSCHPDPALEEDKLLHSPVSLPLCYYKSHLRLALILQHLAEMRGRDASEQAAFNYTVMNWHLPGLTQHLITNWRDDLWFKERMLCLSCSLVVWGRHQFTSSNKKLGSLGKLRYLDADFTLWHKTQGKEASKGFVYVLPSRQNRHVHHPVLTG